MVQKGGHVYNCQVGFIRGMDIKQQLREKDKEEKSIFRNKSAFIRVKREVIENIRNSAEN